MSAADKALAIAAAGTVALLAGVAGAISYSHMAELARLHGEVGWRAHAFPVSVDGIEVVASLVLLAHRRSGRSAGWLPWAALAAGTAASVAANVAVGASDPVGRLVAGWPAVALLVAIKLLAGLLYAGPRAPRAPDDPGAEPAGHRAEPSGPGASVTGRRDGPADPLSEGSGPGAAPSDLVIPVDLVSAARAVRDRLVAEGAPVTRRSLASGLRAAGHRVRNDRLGHLLLMSGGHADD